MKSGGAYIDNLWHSPEVAQAQLELVTRQLHNPLTVPPFRYFLDALQYIPKQRATLLDVGCGVGHYGALCTRYVPYLEYYGTDTSAAMIKLAPTVAPLGHFSVCEFKDNAFDNFDIVLVSQVIEQCAKPEELLRYVLWHTRGWVILHRLRTTTGKAYAVKESTYCDNVASNYYWSAEWLARRLPPSCKVIEWNDAEQQVTIVFEHKK